MKEECLICKAPLIYLLQDTEMECSICGKKESSKTQCTHGHYVCNQCHMQGIDKLIEICLAETSADPVAILRKLMSQPFCHMHGPEHHIMVGASLLTAYKNAGGQMRTDFLSSIKEIISRGRNVPGGACGFWGACGAGISTGIFLSVLTESTPLSTDSWGLSNQMTSHALQAIGSIGGPRCCKRDSYLAIQSAVSFVKEQFGITMELHPIRCIHSPLNNQCIHERCPFFPFSYEC